MKKIVIDMYPVSTPFVGLGEFCRHLGDRISNRADELYRDHNIEIYFLLPPAYKGCFGNHVKYICVPPSLRWTLPLYPIKADLLHIPYQCSKVKNIILAKNRLVTIHDINFVYEKKNKNLRRAERKFRNKIRRADYVNYISNFACEDAERHFKMPQSKKIIYNGVSDLTSLPYLNSLPEGLPDKFMFHISSLQPKKNVHLLVDMMKYIPDRNLVIAGDWENDYSRGIKKSIIGNNLHNIFILPNISEVEKAALYDKCTAFLFPSMCEGFGLPPIEAMKFGKPVFLSKLTSLPEIGGDVSFYWENLDPKSMAEMVKKQMEVLESSNCPADVITQNAARFNWDTCADQYIQYYLEIIDK